MRAILLLSLLALVGCVTPDSRSANSGYVDEGYADGAKIYQIRGCQYAALYIGSHTLVHAGDCPNPIHNCPCDTPKR